jgi:PAS domain S-box-containing protein
MNIKSSLATGFYRDKRKRGLLLEMLGSETRVESLRLVTESLTYVDEAVSLTDPLQNRFLHVNSAWVRLYGYSEKKVMGEEVASFINMPDISERTLLKIRSQTCNGGWEGRLVNRNKRGDEFMVSLRTGCLSDLNGEILAMLGVAIPVKNGEGNGKGAVAKPGRKQRKSKNLESLTARELEVFTQFGHGLNTRQVAAKLGISPYTVQTYRNHLKRKLGATTTAQLNFLAYQWVAENVTELD